MDTIINHFDEYEKKTYVMLVVANDGGYTETEAMNILCEDHVFIKGCIYWLAADYSSREYPNVIFSFDLKREEFNKVRLPGRLSQTHKLEVVEVNESLGVLEYGGDGGCCVWIMEFVTKSFTKMFTVKVPDQLLCNGVLEFRKIGDNKYRLEA
ncbi:putative F-box protein [Tanacetum coccineum]